ncbi:MAG: hypothetical protein IPI27_18385 [Betaproteobacteria bacterium]|nr:hypothetical protein [Betaproteobacteria bacterium]
MRNIVLTIRDMLRVMKEIFSDPAITCRRGGCATRDAAMDDLAALYRARFSEADRAHRDAILEGSLRKFLPAVRAAGLDGSRPRQRLWRVRAAAHPGGIAKIAIAPEPGSEEFLPDGAEFHLRSAPDLSCPGGPAVSASASSSNFFEHLPSEAVLNGC